MMQKPILFTADMVKASDEGRKTHTRRIIKSLCDHEWSDKIIQDIPKEKSFHFLYPDTGEMWELTPQYQPGDHLWIKQNFQIEVYSAIEKKVSGTREDGSEFNDIRLTDREWSKFIKWKKYFQKKSKLFMFKSLAYKWIEVISVRAERLQDIDLQGIIDEGSTIPHVDGKTKFQDNFINLWDSINKDRGFPWESNCYVWDYEFRRIRL